MFHPLGTGGGGSVPGGGNRATKDRTSFAAVANASVDAPSQREGKRGFGGGENLFYEGDEGNSAVRKTTQRKTETEKSSRMQGEVGTPE